MAQAITPTPPLSTRDPALSGGSWTTSRAQGWRNRHLYPDVKQEAMLAVFAGQQSA